MKKKLRLKSVVIGSNFEFMGLRVIAYCDLPCMFYVDNNRLYEKCVVRNGLEVLLSRFDVEVLGSLRYLLRYRLHRVLWESFTGYDGNVYGRYAGGGIALTDVPTEGIDSIKSTERGLLEFSLESNSRLLERNVDGVTEVRKLIMKKELIV